MIKTRKINQHFPQSLSEYFYSKPNALKSNIVDVESVDGMNKHIIEKIKGIKIKNEATAATNIQKVIRGIKTRNTLIESKPISEEAIKDMRNQILKQQAAANYANASCPFPGAPPGNPEFF